MSNARQSTISSVISVAGAIAAGTAVVHWPPSFEDRWFWTWVGGIAVFVLSLRSGVVRGPRWSAGQIAGLSVIIAVGVALRAWSSGTIPAHIDMDEVRPGVEALEIAQQPTPEVFSSVGWFAMPRLSFAFPAVFMAVFPGAPFVALRLSSLVMGVGGIVCTALLGRRVVGVPAAFLGSFLMATSFWHLHDSRTGFPFVQTSFCTALVLYLLVRARQDRSRRVLAAAGLCLGMSLQCYFPLRILLVLVPVWWLATGVHRASTPAVVELLIVAVAALLTLGPLVASVPGPVLMLRSRFVVTVHSLTAFRHHFTEALGMFTTWAEVSLRNRSASALLDLGTLGAVLCGGATVWRRSPYGAALLLSVACTFVLGVVISDNPRAAYRLGPAMPAIFLVAGAGAWHVWTVMSARLPWHRNVCRALAIGVAVLVVAVNCRHFFSEYAYGDGALDVRSSAWRRMGATCDGRAFYVLSSMTPLGSRELLQLFCDAVVRRLDGLSMSDGIQVPDGTTATVLIADDDRDAVAAIRRRYPRATIVEERAADGHVLLTAADIVWQNPAAPLRSAAPTAEAQSACSTPAR